MDWVIFVFILSFMQAFILIPMGFDLSIFNPVRNYNVWRKINWFGIVIITFILNIVFPLYSICYWIGKLFTIGRR